MAAEMLCLSDSNLACLATDNGLFLGNSATPQAQHRYQLASQYLNKIAPDFARLFERAWRTETLAACPTIKTLFDVSSGIASWQAWLKRAAKYHKRLPKGRLAWTTTADSTECLTLLLSKQSAGRISQLLGQAHFCYAKATAP
jgi:hypothetical protein